VSERGGFVMLYKVTIKKTVYVDVDSSDEIEEAVIFGATQNESEEIVDYCEAEKEECPLF
jgi:hypothetical protein